MRVAATRCLAGTAAVSRTAVVAARAFSLSLTLSHAFARARSCLASTSFIVVYYYDFSSVLLLPSIRSSFVSMRMPEMRVARSCVSPCPARFCLRSVEHRRSASCARSAAAKSHEPTEGTSTSRFGAWRSFDRRNAEMHSDDMRY